MSAAAPALQAAGMRRTIASLAFTQMIGWGSTYYIPAVLAPSIRRDLGLSPETIFGGVTVMLVVSAVVAPFAGRYMEKNGARGLLIVGALMIAAALALLSQAQGFWTYLLPWVLIGAATPLALTQAALTAVADRAAGNARRAVSTLLLVSGFSSTIFWPLTSWIESLAGWRGACLAFALVHLCISTSLHIFVLPRAPAIRASGVEAPVDGSGPLVPPHREKRALVLLALAMSLAGFVSWGLPLQAVEILTGVGHSTGTAVWIATLMGPAQVLARVAEVLFGHRIGILNVGLLAAGLMPIVVVLPILLGHSVAAAMVFVFGYGLSAGAMTIVRSVLPLALFGRQRYARLLGQLAVPQNTAFALAPLVFASAMGNAGPAGVLAIAGATSLVAVAALAALALTVRGERMSG